MATDVSAELRDPASIGPVGQDAARFAGGTIVDALFQRPIVVVTGKGGVGKSTVCASLAIQAAGQGKRTLIAEMSGATQIPEMFGHTSRGYEVMQLQPRLHTLSITPESAIREHVLQQIRFKKLYDLVFRNRVMGPFIDAVPGLHDAVQLGKVFDLWRQGRRDSRPLWDLIVVDAPATGHGLTMLSACRSMMELTRSGPFYEEVRQVEDVLGNPSQTALILVCLPEEMPVNETIELWARLGKTRRSVRCCVLNEVLPPPFEQPDDWPVARAHLMDQPSPALAEAVELTDRWLARLEQQDSAAARLQKAIGVPLVSLPQFPQRDLSLATLQELGRCLRAGGSNPELSS